MNVHGYYQLTVFNSGNRAISISSVSIYIQPGDFKTLLDVNPTPPCGIRTGQIVLYGDGSSVRIEARVVDPGRIASIPLEFAWFRKTDPPNYMEQGTVCIRIQAYDYLGRYAVLEYPIDLVIVAQGSSSVNTPPPPNTIIPPRGWGKDGDMRNLF